MHAIVLWRGALTAAATLLGAASCAATGAAPPASIASETNANTAPAAEASTSGAFVRLWEGGCFNPGSCAQYTATLTPDGRVTIDGVSGVRTPGAQEVELGAAAWTAALEALAAAEASGLPTRVASDTAPPGGLPCLHHLPGARITVADATGAERELFWDTGCRHSLEGVPALRDRLREIVGFEERIAPPKT